MNEQQTRVKEMASVIRSDLAQMDPDERIAALIVALVDEAKLEADEIMEKKQYPPELEFLRTSEGGMFAPIVTWSYVNSLIAELVHKVTVDRSIAEVAEKL